MPAGEPVRHQVFEIPVVRAQVSEYRLHGGCCTACGKARRAALPAVVPRGQLGTRALAAWSGQTGVQLMQLYDAHRAVVLGSRVLHADETPIALLDPGAGKTRKAYMWAYARGAFEPEPGVWCSTSVWGAGANTRSSS